MDLEGLSSVTFPTVNYTYSFSYDPRMPKTWFVFEEDRFSQKLLQRCQDLNFSGFESGVISSTVMFSIS